MLDTASLVGNVSFIIVFLAGITSLFAPCVIPLLPVYLGYLSGSDTIGEYKTKKILMHNSFCAWNFSNFFPVRASFYE
jgi:cytochrome c-type biogenesis protein